MFHVAEKPSRDLVWGNQKAHMQQKRLLDHLAFFCLFLCRESAEHRYSLEECVVLFSVPLVCRSYSQVKHTRHDSCWLISDIAADIFNCITACF